MMIYKIFFIAIFLIVKCTQAPRSPGDLSQLHPMLKSDADKSEEAHVIVMNEQEEAKFNKEFSRVQYYPSQYTEHIQNVKKTLIIKGDSETKPLTKIQAWWIDRFITTMNNWLYAINVVLSNNMFIEAYRDLFLPECFDYWMTGRQDYPFQITYQKQNNPKQKQTWNMILYLISFDGLGFSTQNFKSFEIYFKKSNEKQQMENGQWAYRKDRVYDAEVSLEIPSSKVRIKYEILANGEKSIFNPLVHEDKQEMKLGIMRMKLSKLSINIKLAITEIDRRFVKVNPITKETIYFLPPDIKDIRFNVEDVTRYNIEFQYHPNYSKKDPKNLAKNLNVGKAQKLIIEFTDFLKSKDNNKELCTRLRAYLTHRFSRAIMTAKDIMQMTGQWDDENANFDTIYPIFWMTPKDVEMMKKGFYLSYAYNYFFDTAWKLAFHTDWLNVDDEFMEHMLHRFLELQSLRASKYVDTTDDGYDYDEDKRIEQMEKLIAAGMSKQDAEKMVREEYEKVMEQLEKQRAKQIEKEIAVKEAEDKRLEEEEKLRQEKEAEERKLAEEAPKQEQEMAQVEQKRREEENTPTQAQEKERRRG